MMTMNAPAVAPVSPAVPVATTPANAPASAPSEVAAGDFLLMLGQLLGAPVPQGTSAAKAPPATNDLDGEATDAAQDAAALTGVPIPLFTPAQLPSANANADGAIDLLPITAKTTGSSSARAELDLPAELMNTKVVGDDPS